MLISLDQFRGTLPRYGDKVLPEFNAQEAVNVEVLSGELRPAFADPFVKALPALEQPQEYATIYRYLRGTSDTEQWLSWTDDVDVVQGPVFNDVNNRIYITGLTTPRVTDSSVLPADATTVDTTNSYNIGVSRPSVHPTMALSGSGSTALDTRTYVYTYVREWADGKQDESKPSDVAQTSGGVSYVDVNVGQSVSITNIKRPTATDEGDIKYIRFYRSAVGSTGQTSFQFVYEFEADPSEVGDYSKVSWDGSNFTFTDDIPSEQLGEGITSLQWDTPPDGLRGIVSLQNGVLAGFSGRDVYLSEPYRPHAWPSRYVVTLDFDIIGLGSFGNTLVVCTDSHPFLLNVTNPAIGVVPTPVNVVAPCLSKASVVSADNSVFYVTATGVARIDSSGFNLITQDYYTPREWERLKPSRMECEVYRGRYIMSTVDDMDRPRFIYFSMREQQEGVIESTSFSSALYTDIREDSLYGVIPTDRGSYSIHLLDDVNSRPKAFKWTSKQVTSHEGLVNMAAARVLFSDYEYENTGLDFNADALGYLNSSTVNSYPLGGDLNSRYGKLFSLPYLDFVLYSNNKEVFRKRVRNEKPFRLPSGIRGKYFHFTLEGNIPVARIDIATSIGELN